MRLLLTSAATNKRTATALLLVSLFIIGLAALPISQLQTDTRPNAFLAADNPALVYRERVRDTFGLSDPIIVALVDSQPSGVFTPEALSLLLELHHDIANLHNVDQSRVISLASEKEILATSEGMDVKPLLEAAPKTQGQADLVREAVDGLPLLRGNLVSEKGNATIIVAELIDESLAEHTYNAIVKLTQEKQSPATLRLHVAGEGAIAGYLSQYIDADAKRLNPAAWAIIMLVLYFAHRRLGPALAANIIIAASVVTSVGLMAALNIPFYMITSALPVILIGISVADTIHIYGHFYHLAQQHPQNNTRQLIQQTLADMWRPVTLTTLTTMAGFLGLYFSAQMPPFKYFGFFAAIGVGVAWLYSIIFLPAAILLFKPLARAPQPKTKAHEDDRFTHLMREIGRITLKRARWVVACGFGIALLGAWSASQLIVDEEPINIFHPSEPLYQADKAINKHLAGTNALDIVIESSTPGGLLQPQHMQRIQALQEYALTLPHVGGAISYLDYLKEMNQAVRGGSEEYYRLPESEALAAQYFLVYSATSDPTDFEEEIDYDYQIANLRVNFRSGSYHQFKPAVEQLQAYIEHSFNDTELTATLSGRVNLNYHWIGDLGANHLTGLLTALVLVWLIATLLFRSAWAGTYTLIPVAGAILLVYATMAAFNMHLGVGTSMFAAVALGLGVDFSIHTLERIKVAYSEHHADWARAFNAFYTSTGRALLMNFLAIACGFGVLMSSQVASLNNFGAMIVVAITSSFVASMTLLPALVVLFKPSFIVNQVQQDIRTLHWKTWLMLALVTILSALLLLPSASAETPQPQPSQTELSALDIVDYVNTQADDRQVTRYMTMKLTDRRGKARVRETVVYRKHIDDQIRTIVFYTHPANLRDTAFLTWDYPQQSDDQWLYLSALRKVKRIPSADRGDYFMGTDFTYEDIKLDGKLSVSDYHYTIVSRPLAGDTQYTLVATPVDDDIAQELGYGKIEMRINADNWLITQGVFYDLKQRMLKTMDVVDAAQIDGIWTRLHIKVSNHTSGHQTELLFSDVDYASPIDDRLFSKRAMERGAP